MPLASPLQARSAETTRRMIDAAEALLAQRSFDETSVNEIARRAGVTTGAFYARFGDKNGLLNVLEAELHEAFESLADRQAAPTGRSAPAVTTALRQHHERLVHTYRAHRGAARALLLRSHTDPALRARIDKLNQRNLPRIAKAIAQLTRSSHPAAERALRFALLTVRSVCRETLLYDQRWPGGRALSDRELVDELTRMVVAYLGISAGARR